MPKLKPGTIIPTPEEDAAIQRGIKADPDTHELGDAFFNRARRGRGPQRKPVKERITIRLDGDVVEHFRATGPGWQGRVNDALRREMARK